MMSKAKKIVVCVVLLCFVFVSTADAILWFLAGLIRAGAVAVTAFISTPMGQSIVRSAINHALILGGAAYLFLDRGVSVPPEERYIRVTLTDTKAAVAKMNNDGKFSLSGSPTGGWATGSTDSGCLNCYAGITCDRFRIASPSGSLACPADFVGAQWVWDGTWQTQSLFTSCSNGVLTTKKNLVVCTTAQKNAWVSAGGSLDEAVKKVFADNTMKADVQSAIGSDLQRGGVLVSTSVSGEPVLVVGADGVSKEWSSGTPESQMGDWLGNAPVGDSVSSGSSGASASDIGTAVGSAVNPGVSSVNTSVQAVKTSVDGVKTSVDAIDTKLGTNPGNATAPSYDSDYTNPTENSITDRLGSFISSNPIIGAISGSHLSLSGAVCSVSVGSAFEKSLTLDFCWMEQYLVMFGNVLVIFAGLTAAFIIFRRGD